MTTRISTRSGQILNIIFWGALLTPRCHAQIVLDGTVGPAGVLTGPNYQITHDLGTIFGNNLFHSFSDFNLLFGESATFTGPNSIANILSRVTGGNPSSIDGLLTSTIPGVNFFFLNPNGVLFGPNAKVDVGGAFVVSTADYLKLKDGGVFHSKDPSQSVLTSAPPSAFGFLGPNPASIRINGSTLEVKEGKSFSMIGGDLQVTGGTVKAPGGRVNLVSVGSTGEVNLDVTDPTAEVDVSSFADLGDISLTDSSEINVDGIGGGSVVVSGENLFMADCAISDVTTGAADGGVIDISLEGDLELANQSSVRSETEGTGDGGDITIDAGTIVIRNGGLIGAGTFGSGDGGSITVSGQIISLIDGGKIKCLSKGTGDAGNILVTSSDAVELTGENYISTSTTQSNGGNIEVSAGTSIHLIDSGITAAAGGDGGQIKLTAPEIVYLQNSELTAQVGGTGGNISIDPTYVVLNSSHITADAIHGYGGMISIVANVFLTCTDSLISASSQFGVRTNVPTTAVGGSLIQLSSQPLSIEGYLQERCRVRRQQKRSSFTVSGQGGLITEPTGLMPSAEVK